MIGSHDYDDQPGRVAKRQTAQATAGPGAVRADGLEPIQNLTDIGEVR